MSEYNAAEKSNRTIDEALAVVGRRAELTLTGRIVDAGESAAGVFVKFKVDSRWGFSEGFKLVMDLDPLVVEEAKDDG